jgi:hypothetical protein
MVYAVGLEGLGAGGAVEVQGVAGSPSKLFTRPNNTTNYGIGDVIGETASANLELPLAGSVGSLLQILSAELTINRTSLPTGMTTLRVHLFDQSPAAIADNAPFAVAAADRLKYCGLIPLATPTAIGGGFLFTFGDYVGRPIRLVSTSIWANLVTDTAITSVVANTEYRLRLHAAEVGA